MIDIDPTSLAIGLGLGAVLMLILMVHWRKIVLLLVIVFSGPQLMRGIVEGHIVNGEIQGPGKMTFPDGHIVEGNFVNSEIQGDAKITFPDGRSVKGPWPQSV